LDVVKHGVRIEPDPIFGPGSVIAEAAAMIMR